MKIPIGELISKADAEVLKLNHAPSTLMQYRWAWYRFAVFCSERGINEFTDETVAVYLQSLTEERTEGRFKEWKYKLLRKTALVLQEVNETGTYQWKLSKHAGPNDELNGVFRPVQEHFEGWLTQQVWPRAHKSYMQQLAAGRWRRGKDGISQALPLWVAPM